MIDEDLGTDSSTEPANSKSNSIRAYVSDLICRASEAEDFNAQEIMDGHPELRKHRSLVLDLAYEEYCRKLENGDDVKQTSFAKRFPEYEESLLRVLQVHQYLETSESKKKKQKTPWPKPGEVFGEYRLLELIGRGSFAFVYIAEQLNVAGRQVVLKITRDALAEVETLGRLDHPNIVQIFTVESDVNGFTAICMPLISQVTLFDLLAELHGDGANPTSCQEFVTALKVCIYERQGETVDLKQLTVPTTGQLVDAIIQIGIDVCNALAYSHEREILHCDIKPTNILVSAEGRSMLFDFNLSAKSNTTTGRIGGTLPYMPPEQLQALVSSNYDFEATKAVDMYSFGVTIFQLLTGRLPFGDLPDAPSQQESARILLRRQQAQEIDFGAVKGLNSGFKKIIEDCLSFDPEKRPGSALELQQRLRREKGILPRTRRWLIKNPVKMLVWLLILTIVVPSSILGYSYFSQIPRRTVMTHLENGREAEKAFDFDLAIAEYELALAAANEHLPELRFLTLCHLTMVSAKRVSKDRQEVASAYLQQIKEEFGEEDPLIGKIELSLLATTTPVNIKHFQRAQVLRNKLINRDDLSLDDSCNFLTSVIRFYTRTKQYDYPLVESLLQQILDQDPNHVEANWRLFLIEFKRKYVAGNQDQIDYSLLEKCYRLRSHSRGIIIEMLAKAKRDVNANRISAEEYLEWIKIFAEHGGKKSDVQSALNLIKEPARSQVAHQIHNLNFQPHDLDYLDYMGVVNPLKHYLE